MSFQRYDQEHGLPDCCCGVSPQMERLANRLVRVSCEGCKLTVEANSTARARARWIRDREMRRPENIRMCPGCGSNVFSFRQNMVYCNPQCRKQHYHKRICADLQVERAGDLSSATVGAIGELVACSDLLLRGLEVFRAVSPSCSCDLVVSNGQESNRVEVRTANMRIGGSYWVPRNGVYDTLAVVIGKTVVYEGKPLPTPTPKEPAALTRER